MNQRSTYITKLISLGLGLCLSTFAFSQKQSRQEADSLIKILPRYMASPDSMLILSKKLISIAENSKNTHAQAMGSKFSGIAYFLLSSYDHAEKQYDQALKLFTLEKDSLEIAKALYNLATVHNARFNYQETTVYAIKALKIFDKINDINGIGRIYNLLGIAAHVHEDFQKAIAYLKKYNQLVTQAGDSLEITTSYSNLGGTYTEIKETDSAIFFLRKAEQIAEKNRYTRALGSLYQNIGLLYEEKGDLELAIKYLNKGLHVSKNEGNSTRAGNIHYNLGRILRKKNQSSLAKDHLIHAISISNQTDDKQILYGSYEQLAYISADQGNFKAAYEYLFDSKGFKDSVFQIEKQKTIEELKTKYESEKKENEILTLNQKTMIQELKLKQQTNLLVLAAAILISIVALGALLIKQRKLKADALLQQRLKEQQEEASRNILHVEEQERRRIAADLHDGVGQILSAALLNLREFDKELKSKGVVNETFLSNSLELVQDTYTEMRQVSHQMMPNTLLKTGLAHSIREFIQKLEHDRIQTHLDLVGLHERLDPQVETFLYRCIQEAVTNVIKHADANLLSIQLIQDLDGISLSIEDNGKGFDQKHIHYSEGVGIRNIRSRVSIMGGDLDIHSSPDKGTILMIHIPEAKLRSVQTNN